MATIAQMQREAARQEATRRRAHAAAQREAERARAAQARAQAADERERKRLYVESRVVEVADMNEQLEEDLEDLDSFLVSSLRSDPYLNVESLKQPVDVRPYDPGALGHPEPVPRPESFLPSPQSGMSRLLGGARHEEKVRQGWANHQRACAEHAAREQTRLATLAQNEEAHRRRTQHAQEEARRQHAEVDELRRGLEAGRPDAVVAYLDLVLNTRPYPDDFPQQWRLAYVPESRQLVVEYEMPLIVVIPTVKTYKYVKSSDSITETARPATQVKAQYKSVVGQVALRVVNDVLRADRIGHVGTVVFNGMVSTTDAATGREIRPCLLTLRTTRETFSELDLSRVDPAACLQHLGAGVSRSPAELTPVRPVLEFDMVDPRFVEETDVMGDLERRPNLLEMSPTEFESLIQNLFTRMGLEARQTRASRDGGVDCVAFDQRAILGGKVVIQAKRYRNTADGAVRHLGREDTSATACDRIEVALAGLHPGVARVVLAASVDGDSFGGVERLRFVVSRGGAYAFVPSPTTETALVCAELYRRHGGWRLRAIGQGYDDGLAGLARDYGVNVD